MAQLTGSLTSYPARVSFTAYVFTILIGGFLLTLPVSRQPDRPAVSLVDGLFTATSACCVTGLVVRSTPHDFSFFGQSVILVLMQLGGLGIMTITTLFAFQLGGQATLRQQAVVAETLGIKGGKNLRSVAIAVFLVVALTEFMGFLILAWATWGQGSPGEVLWWSAFHAVSAFCNAGFALADDSLMGYAGNVSVNAAIAMLIIIGGIGFPVILDLMGRARQGQDFWQRLSVHTKLMLLGTAILIVAGAISFWVFERDGVLAGKPLSTRILTGLFHSVTCRTAGFNTVDYGSLANPTLFLAIILMSIGAGPASTGGGFKVSTFMTLAVSSWSSFRGLPRANFGRRTIPASAIRRATATALLFGAVGVVSLLALLSVESGATVAERPRWFLEALFECISALGTVGLSTGITPMLSDAGKVVLMILMLLGRLGPLTAAVALSRQRTPYQPEYLEEEPLVG
jgi:trk system potassium uptake protein TrkH